MLVTGASGFIGRRVVQRLATEGRPVIAVEHAWHGEDELDELAAGAELAACIHLGWYARPADYLVDVAGNLESLRSSCALVGWLGRRGVTHLVAVGSGAEYGVSDEPHDEDECPDPWSVYGAAKSAFHQLLRSSMRPQAMRVAWARVFNVTGPGEHPDRLVPTVVRRLLAGDPVDLSPGGQVRDFLDVDDVASALVALSTAGAEGTFNVCSGHGIVLRDLLGGIGDRLGRRDLLRFGARPYGDRDPPVVLGRAGRLAAATGWAPAHDTGAMIDRALGYWRERSKGPA